MKTVETITVSDMAKRLGTTVSAIQGMHRNSVAPRRLAVGSGARLSTYRVRDVEEWLEDYGRRFARHWYGPDAVIKGSTRHLVPADLLPDYDELAGMIKNWEFNVDVQKDPPDGFASACWLWLAADRVKVNGSNSLKVTGVVYSTAFPDAPAYPRGVQPACGSAQCVNPDHLLDKYGAFWENLEFLLDQGVKTTTIEERLKFRRGELWERFEPGSTEREAIANRFRRQADIESGEYDYETERGQLAEVIEFTPRVRAA